MITKVNETSQLSSYLRKHLDFADFTNRWLTDCLIAWLDDQYRTIYGNRYWRSMNYCPDYWSWGKEVNYHSIVRQLALNHFYQNTKFRHSRIKLSTCSELVRCNTTTTMAIIVRKSTSFTTDFLKWQFGRVDREQKHGVCPVPSPTDGLPHHMSPSPSISNPHNAFR